MDQKATAWERAGAALYDPFLARGERRGMARRRAALVGHAEGDVLEIGAGTGLNVAHYPRTGGRLVLTEPLAPMVDRLRRRAATRDDLADVEVVAAPAEALPFADASFDTVVSTLVLCTVRSPDAALAELVRVLRPGGTLLFAEHVRAEGRLGRRQRRWARPWSAFAGGCRCDRDLLTAVRDRFDVVDLEHATWAGMPSIVRPLVIGAGRPRAGLDSERAEPAERGAARPSRGR